MKCPSCGSRETTVKDSRPLDSTIRRRRQCRTCHHRWTTIEAEINDDAPTTTQVLTAELAKIHDLSEQVADLKIQNSVLRAQNLNYFLDNRPHLVFVLGTGSPPYKIGITRNVEKIRSQYSEPTLTGLKLLYQKRHAHALYARITKQQAYDHFREKGITGEWIKAPLGEVISTIDHVTDRIKKLFPQTDKISGARD